MSDDLRGGWMERGLQNSGFSLDIFDLTTTL